MVWKKAVKTAYEKESLSAFEMVSSKNWEQKMDEESDFLTERRKAIKSGRMMAFPLEPLKVNSRHLLSGFEKVHWM